MAARLFCCSHSPLMLTDIEPTDISAQDEFNAGLERIGQELAEFDPELVVVFGPDHFNGFFYELMPAFCIGAAATATHSSTLSQSQQSRRRRGSNSSSSSSSSGGCCRRRLGG